jgi:hypothetical protein
VRTWPLDAMELSTPTQFSLSASQNQQVWVESSTLRCALLGPISSFPLGQAALPERHKQLGVIRAEALKSRIRVRLDRVHGDNGGKSDRHGSSLM